MEIIGCGSSDAVDDRLTIAEELMEERPDSALCILNDILESEIRGNRIKARYALLKSIALDKNYIDTTTFEVLQPAIDYYLTEGNADEKLRTLYYKGRIHRNAGEYDLAMQMYLSGLDLEGEITDSLTFSRLLVAQGTLFYRQYQIQGFVNNNLKAGDIFGKKGEIQSQLRCYGKALNGAIILSDKSKADSIAKICESVLKDSSYMNSQLINSFLGYASVFVDIDKTKKIIGEVLDYIITDDTKMSLARAYSKIGNPKEGLRYLNELRIGPEDILDSLTYWSVKTDILEDLGEEKMALNAYKNYSRLLEIYHDRLFSSELLFSEKKHQMEIENMAKIRKRDNAIKWILTGTIILIFLIGIIYYRYRLNRAGRLIAEGKAERLQLETEKLQLERDNLQLEADNLRLEVGQLEEERERLNGLLARQDNLSTEARHLIRERLDMLNGLFAKALTNEENYGREFQQYVDKIKKNKKRFQESIVKVLEATHPDLMKYLKDHDLTEREINYVSLYAIGLRGKEIGNYLDLARHYNISTNVRRKLGLDRNGENLGPFIRKMMGE